MRGVRLFAVFECMSVATLALFGFGLADLGLVVRRRKSKMWFSIRAIVIAFGVVVGISGSTNAAPIPGQGTWETTLLGRAPTTAGGIDYQAYYDVSRDITWLADADLARTSGYDTDGKMTWDEAVSWIDFLNNSNYLGVSAWKLPSAMNTNGIVSVNSYNSGDNAMNYLYGTTLGNVYGVGGGPIVFNNPGPFENIQTGNYWLSTETCGYSSCSIARRFDFAKGYLGSGNKPDQHPGWAIASGDLIGAPATIPEATTIMLFAVGLAGLSLAARRRTVR